jgi:hypothetical protein
MKTKSFLFLIILLFLGCYSCSKDRYIQSEPTTLACIVTSDKPEFKDDKSDIKNTEIDKRKIIKDGSLQIEVDSIVKTKKLIDKLVKSYQGYYASERYVNSQGSSDYLIKIRVPSEKFDSMIFAIEKGKNNMLIVSKNISARDVTAEFIDLETRLNNKRGYLQRYKELLKKANSVKDILEIQGKTREIEEEIESTEGKLQYYDDLIAYSSLDITLTIRKEYIDKPFFQGSFWKRLGQAFVSGWFGFIEFIIYFFRIWPVWIITALTFYIIKRLVRRRMNRSIK